jgi:hypothetical protein
MSVPDLKKWILIQCDILQAIWAFNYRLTPDLKRTLDEYRSKSLVSTARSLRIMRDAVKQDVAIQARRFGCVQKPREFAAKFIGYSRRGPGIQSISKAAIDSDWFTNFCGGIEEWKRFPPHLRLVVNFEHVCSTEIRLDYLLTEAMLYEDMALAYNEAVSIQPQIKSVREAKANLQVKKLQLHLRTALLSAYYFVEAYLNGIAYDFYYRHESEITDQEKTALLEWDYQKNRRAWVSFERKVFDYPKIILKAPHPPLTTSNSKNLQVLLGDAKDFRDAIVHQSPKTDDVLKPPEKVASMLRVGLPEVTVIVDAAVGFVRELNAALGKEGMLLDWLCIRTTETGLFPPESFA